MGKRLLKDRMCPYLVFKSAPARASSMLLRTWMHDSLQQTVTLGMQVVKQHSCGQVRLPILRAQCTFLILNTMQL